MDLRKQKRLLETIFRVFSDSSLLFCCPIEIPHITLVPCFLCLTTKHLYIARPLIARFLQEARHNCSTFGGRLVLQLTRRLGLLVFARLAGVTCT